MSEPGIEGGVGAPQVHDSAHLHVTGEAAYIDDMAEPRGTLHAAVGMSQRAHARIDALDLTRVRAAPGVVAVITAAEVPGRNDYGTVFGGDPIFAESVVAYAGQSMFAVAARTMTEARRAARLAVVGYAELEPVLDIEQALAAESFVLPTETMTRGDAGAAIAKAPNRLHGRLRMGGQEQFYLEGQIAFALPQEDGKFLVYSSSQHPGEVQQQVAHALGRERFGDVTVECRRMGGGFGGKETQPGLFACIAALLAE